MQTVLAIEGVSKTYRRGPLVNDGVTLHAAAGEVYGILGHNGAGKTTLVNQVVGLLKPDVPAAGGVVPRRVRGHRPGPHPARLIPPSQMDRRETANGPDSRPGAGPRSD